MILVPVIIPAFRPDGRLRSLVKDLIAHGCSAIVVVDDGSGPEYQQLFEELEALGGVRVLRHAVNMGKGAALKTAMNYVLIRFPESCGVVTADADGQHRPKDIFAVAGALRLDPKAVILGTREFGRQVPWRSRLGNRATRVLLHVLTGQKLSDTQTGLRGIPISLLPHLIALPSAGYEFELDMLLACRYRSCRIVEQPIETVYLNDNRGSHFNPILDSARIYLLLLRFSVLSLCTAVLDNLVFGAAHGWGASTAQSQIAGRLVAMCFNYLGARYRVFHSRQRDRVMLPKYVLLVLCSGTVSFALIRFLQLNFGIRLMLAKVLAEGILFIANFSIQRDFIFTRRESHQQRTTTDWDRYYLKVPLTAKLTRRYSTAVLLEVIKRHTVPSGKGGEMSIVEIGGAKSCFLDAIISRFPCESYDIIDTNEYGLSLLANQARKHNVVRLHNASIFNHALGLMADLVFSVGLVEHFQPDQTRAAVLAHFDLLRPGGIVIITFPTPTRLYRITRGLIRALGLWRFPDERPLDPQEVITAIRERGGLVWQKTLWPLMLTQHLVVAQKGSFRSS